MAKDYYGDYYGENILLKNKKLNSIEDINITKLKLLIKAGLSSVKISQIIGMSYVAILRATDKKIPEFSVMLRDNGKKHQIRKAKIDKVS